MSRTALKADNWEAVCCGATGGGAAVTGGVWVFQFRNRQLDVRASYGFAGPGVGVGLRAGATGGVGMTLDDDDFCPIDTVGAMSLDDLDGASGWINSAGASLGVGGGAMFITANNMGGTLFGFQCLYGLSLGLEASVNFWTVGVWGRARNDGIKPYLVNREPTGHDYPPWVHIKCRVARQSIVVGPRAQVQYNYDVPVPRGGENVMTPGN